MLTPSDIRCAFLAATHSVAGARLRWNNDVRVGRTDEQLAERLRYELGTFGGWLTHAGVEAAVRHYIAMFQRRLRFSRKRCVAPTLTDQAGIFAWAQGIRSSMRD